jgi:Glycosyl transferase family 2
MPTSKALAQLEMRGVAASKGSILAFIDSDCLPNLDWIEKGVAGIQSYDFIGGSVIVTS